MAWGKTKKGFTIVELLVVVVVVAILATITIVSYNGISKKAHASVDRAELVSFHKVLQVMASDGVTFDNAKTWNAALHNANIYEVTDENYRGSRAKLGVCATASEYAVVSTRGESPSTGDLVLHLTSGSGVQELSWDDSTPGVYILDKFCTQVLPDSTVRVWTGNWSVRDEAVN